MELLTKRICITRSCRINKNARDGHSMIAPDIRWRTADVEWLVTNSRRGENEKAIFEIGLERGRGGRKEREGKVRGEIDLAR